MVSTGDGDNGDTEDDGAVEDLPSSSLPKSSRILPKRACVDCSSPRSSETSRRRAITSASDVEEIEEAVAVAAAAERDEDTGEAWAPDTDMR